jgi:hypothetical protein
VDPHAVPIHAVPPDSLPGTAVSGLSQTASRQSTVVDRADELYALLCSYSDILASIDKSPGMLWAPSDRSRNPRWLRFPAPRALVRTILVRHIGRSVSALRRCAARRVALTNEAPTPLRDLKMLERFEQSLPPGPRLNLIAPIALLGTLLIAFLFAYGVGSTLSPLLGDLAKAAADFDRGEAVEAFKKDPVELHLYAGVAMFITWSVVTVIALLLPAFAVKREMLRGAHDIEMRVFATQDCGRVDDVEPGLLAQVLLTGEVAVIGAIGLVYAPVMIYDFPSLPVFMHYFVLAIFYLTGVGLLCLTVAAAVELRCRYAERRAGTARRHAGRRIFTVIALWLVSGIGVFMPIYLVMVAINGGHAI